MKDPNRTRVEGIGREIERLKEEYAGSRSGGKRADEANEARRQRLIELKQELAQMLRKTA
jgi:hypothetical protein